MGGAKHWQSLSLYFVKNKQPKLVTTQKIEGNQKLKSAGVIFFLIFRLFCLDVFAYSCVEVAPKHRAKFELNADI